MNYPKLILIILLPLFTQPLFGHEHREVGVVGSGPGGAAAGGEALQFIGADGTDQIHFLRPRGLGSGPRPSGSHPELRGGGYYYLDELPRRVYDLQGNPLFENPGEPLVASEGFSLVALSAHPDFPEVGHAHAGALIACEIVSVAGPPGARFGFWGEEVSYTSGTPTFSLSCNQPTGNPRFRISEGTDEADADPYGHIHNRAWTADKPGDYFVTIRFIDISTNRSGGIPWHLPSQNYIYHFKAGPDFTPTGQWVSGVGFVLTWPSQMGISAIANLPEIGVIFRVLRSSTLVPSEWILMGEVTGTSAKMLNFTDLSPPPAKAFYRLSYDWSAP